MKWVEVTADRYEEMLNVLPPVEWNKLGFLVGEANSHRKCTVTGYFRADYSAFVALHGKHYACEESLTIPEWRAITPQSILENMNHA